MVWNVAGELVSPKNITVGSKSPYGVLNAALCSSPCFDADIVVSPSYVEFGVDVCTTKVFDEGLNQW